MNKRWKPWIAIAASILFAAAAAWLATPRPMMPPLPAEAQMASEPLETRIYRWIEPPERGSDLKGIWQQTRWRIFSPGQVRLIEMEKAPGVIDLQAVLGKMGYPFPAGTSADVDEETPRWIIRHHPSVLDHLERYLDLERDPSATPPPPP